MKNFTNAKENNILKNSIITAHVCSTREGNVLTSVCPSIHPSVCPQGGYPYPIMLCNISQNAMRQRGGTQTPPGGTQVRYPPGGTRVRYPPGGGYPGQVPPRGVPRSGTPPGGYPGQVPPRVRYPPGGSGYPPRGVPDPGTPPGGYLTRGGTQLGQQKEYSLHGGRYASCVHTGGLSCFIYIRSTHCEKGEDNFSDASNESFLLCNDERERKYEAAQEPFKHFHFITQQLCASENEKSKSDSESSMNYKLQLQILKNINVKI